MQNRKSRRNVRLCQLAVLSVLGLLQAGNAQTVTLAGFEGGTNEFNVLGNAAQYTFTTGATAGATEGANSLKVDMLTTVQSGDPLDYQFSDLGVDYEGRGTLLTRNKFSFDVTVPAGQSTGTPVDLQFQVFMQGSSQPNWGGWAGMTSPTFMVPEGATSMTLTFDYTGPKSAFNNLVANQWWQTIIQAKNTGEKRTFYIDNLRTWGMDSTANAEWKNPAGGNWGTATNWNPETVPLNLDSTAVLGTYGGTITGSPSINMDSSPVLKSLTLNTPSGQGYTLSGSGAIAINSSVNDGFISVLSGQHTINVPLNMADSVSTLTTGGVINVAAGAQLTVANFLAEWLDVAKEGDGTLVINKLANIGFQIRGGTVQMSADATGNVSTNLVNAGTTLDINGHLFMSQWYMGSAAGTTINLGTGGTLTFNNGGGVLNSDIFGSGEINVIGSSQNLSLQGSASTFTAPIRIENGAKLTVNNGGALGDAANTVYLTDSTLAATGPVYGYGHTVAISGTGTIDTGAHPMFLGMVQGGSLTKMGTGTASLFKVSASGATVLSAGGVLQISPSGSNDATSVMGSLSLDDGMGGTGAFDLTNNKVIVQSGDLATIRSQIIAGYAGGSWNGVGIVSSTAMALDGKAVGYANAGSVGLNGGSFGGIGVSTGNILLAYTLQGDSNLDFKVDSVDFGFFVGNYGKLADGRWDEGDYNYDGKVNSEDFNYIAGNFSQTLTFAAPTLGAAVPEPTALGLLFAPMVVAGLGRRRR